MVTKTQNRLNTSEAPINWIAQVLFASLFLISALVIPKIYSLVLPIMVFGTFIIYYFSPALSFLFAFLFIIDPFAQFKLSGIAIVPILLSFTWVILNTEKSIFIISKDRLFMGVIRVSLLFSIYQVILSILFFSQKDLYYLLINSRYWLGILMVIPAYLFIVVDKVNLLIGLLIVAGIIIILYYLSFTGVYSVFDFREFKRMTDDDDILRYFSFDLRQITKIFVYLLPMFLVLKVRDNSVKFLVIIIGLLVYLSVALAILRTEMFYLFMGAFMSFYFAITKFQKKSYGFLLITPIMALIAVNQFFPELIDNLITTFETTLKSGGGFSSDQSADHRLYVQLPILLEIFQNNLFFGAGLFAVSYEATQHHLLYDIPILGAFGAYGIFGMLLYYYKYVYIFKSYRSVKFTRNISEKYKLESIIVFGLLSYFITMITFRILHINIELAFDYGATEFGLFIGIYFGLIRKLKLKTN